MRAALIDRFNGPIDICDVPDPACPTDGVVVRLEACGVCRSDHHAWKGLDPDVRLPHVMGHELAGTILECGPACHGFAVGQRVTAPFILSCGHCPDCQGGQPTICDQQQVIGFTQWGAFAEYVAIPHADFNLVSLPHSLSFDAAASMGCRMTTAFRALTERGRLAQGEWLAVVGCGGVGLSAVMIAKALGARLVAIDLSPAALDQARMLGADHTLNPSAFDSPQAVGEAVREITGGGAHVAIDAMGITPTSLTGLYALRKLGRYVQVGMPVGQHTQLNLPLLDLVYARQIQISGSRGMAAQAFPALLDLIETGAIQPQALISQRIALAQVGAVLAAMDQPGQQGAGIAVITNFA